MNDLFRPEALNQGKSHWLGTTLIQPMRGGTGIVIFSLLVIAAIIVLATQFGFSRKVKVNGWIVPQGGVLKVHAIQPGTVTRLFVSEGQIVEQGAPLAVISTDRSSGALGSTQTEIARLLQSRKASIEKEILDQDRSREQQMNAAREKISALHAELKKIQAEIDFQERRVANSATQTAKYKAFADSGLTTLTQYLQQQDQELEQVSRLRSLERQLVERKRELVTLTTDLQALPLKFQQSASQLSREIRTLEQEMTEATVRREYTLLAPQKGVVSSLQIELGGAAQVNSPLLSLLPSSAHLEAHLYAPSRAVGLIKANQKVMLRYQSFPYQKFGHQDGTVKEVSRTTISPGELPAQLTGVSGLTGSGEPIYRITVQLTRQSVPVMGQAQAIQAGMLLESDVMLEKRKLWEWALEPLLTLTGRV